MTQATPKIVTLTSDFGTGSPYVAELKGSVLATAPFVTLVDVTHAVPPQDVMQGALTLRQVHRAFPEGTIHVAVVDPGVGTQRGLLLVAAGRQYFIGPDNGLLSLVVDNDAEVWRIDRPEFWRPEISRTFHGRDIMAPVAGHLARGVEPAQLATRRIEDVVRLSFPRPCAEGNTIRGQVTQVDSFGNLITNIHSSSMPGGSVDGVEILGETLRLVATYSLAEGTRPIALVGSSGWLEVGVFRGNARESLRADVGTEVLVRLCESPER